eukprot:PhM_4_TR13466/c0_g1_i1/m.99054
MMTARSASSRSSLTMREVSSTWRWRSSWASTKCTRTSGWRHEASTSAVRIVRRWAGVKLGQLQYVPSSLAWFTTAMMSWRSTSFSSSSSSSSSLSSSSTTAVGLPSAVPASAPSVGAAASSDFSFLSCCVGSSSVSSSATHLGHTHDLLGPRWSFAHLRWYFPSHDEHLATTPLMAFSHVVHKLSSSSSSSSEESSSEELVSPRNLYFFTGASGAFLIFFSRPTSRARSSTTSVIQWLRPRVGMEDDSTPFISSSPRQACSIRMVSRSSCSACTKVVRFALDSFTRLGHECRKLHTFTMGVKRSGGLTPSSFASCRTMGSGFMSATGMLRSSLGGRMARAFSALMRSRSAFSSAFFLRTASSSSSRSMRFCRFSTSLGARFAAEGSGGVLKPSRRLISVRTAPRNARYAGCTSPTSGHTILVLSDDFSPTSLASAWTTSTSTASGVGLAPSGTALVDASPALVAGVTAFLSSSRASNSTSLPSAFAMASTTSAVGAQPAHSAVRLHAANATERACLRLSTRLASGFETFGALAKSSSMVRVAPLLLLLAPTPTLVPSSFVRFFGAGESLSLSLLATFFAFFTSVRTADSMSNRLDTVMGPSSSVVISARRSRSRSLVSSSLSMPSPCVCISTAHCRSVATSDT